MKRWTILFLLALGFSLSANAQGWALKGTSGQKVLELQDGHLLSYGSGGLAKITATGAPLWQHSILTNDTVSLAIESIKELESGQLVFGGQLYYRGQPNGNITPNESSAIVYGLLDADGNLVWDKSAFLGTEDKWDKINYTFLDGDHFVFGGIYDSGSPSQNLFIMKTDAQGNEIWFQTFENTPLNSTTSFDMEQLADGGFALLASSFGFSNRQLTIGRLDQSGTMLWYQSYGAFSGISDYLSPDLVVASDQTFFLADEIGTLDGKDIHLIHVSVTGDSLSNTTIENIGDDNITDFIATTDGGYAITGFAESGPLGGEDVFLRKLDANLQTEWVQYYGGIINDWGTDIEQTQDGGYAIAVWQGTFSDFLGSNNFFTHWLYKTDSLGQVYSNKLTGNVFEDLDLSCLNEAEKGRIEWLVAAESAEHTFYGITDSLGNYCLPVDTGDYTVQLTLPSNYWTVCDNDIPVSFTDADTTAIDFPAQIDTECPAMEVDISTPFLRRCFPNTYTVSYCNKGTAVAENAYVEVELDAFIHFENASIPWIQQNGQQYRFDLGDVEAGHCGTFQINVMVDCDSTLLGQTHCVEAHIYPDSICIPSPDWSGASVEVDASCAGDSVVFTITNVGTAPTSGPLQYIVIVDQVILLQGDFNLNPGESKTFAQAADGSTQRLEAQQEPFHPGNNMPSVTIEGCGDDNGQISLGYVTQYSQNDGDPFVAIDCQENIGSFDPNDKRAYPKGYGPDHLIEANTDLEYLIRFQNTGTDTAFTVVVRDQLAEELDITSLRVGSSSHPYRLNLQPDRTLEFHFDDILLPDSTTNEPASHGFIKFRISQKPDLPNGNKIRNRAAIYFDFNSPIITNTVEHQIGENFIKIELIESPVVPVTSKVYPNPFEESTTIEFSGLEGIPLILSLYDVSGRLVRQESHLGPQISFQRRQLPKGLYVYRIHAEGRMVNMGKIVIQ